MPVVTKKAGSEEYGRWIKALIVGGPGSGKTLISSTFPNPYYANAEGGLMSVADRGVPFTEIRQISDLDELRTFLELPPDLREASLGVPVDTVIIDTIDEVQRILIRERIESERIPQLRIQDWGWLNEQMQSVLRGFRNLDMNVVFTCHSKDMQDDESRVVYKPALQGAIASDVPGYVDLALLLTSQSKTVIVENEARRVTVRYLQTYQDPQHPWVKDRSGKLPGMIEVNFEDDYQRIHDTIFSATVPESSVVLPAAASAQQKKAVENARDEMNETPVPVPMLESATYRCMECGVSFDDSDQAALSKIKTRRTLCKVCYRKQPKTRYVERTVG